MVWYSFNKYLLSTYIIPDTILGTGVHHCTKRENLWWLVRRRHTMNELVLLCNVWRWCLIWGEIKQMEVRETNSNTVTMVAVVSHYSCVQLFATPWTVACHAPLFMGFSQQEYWSGLPCPPQGGLPDPHLLCLLHCRWIFFLNHLTTRKAHNNCMYVYIIFSWCT